MYSAVVCITTVVGGLFVFVNIPVGSCLSLLLLLPGVVGVCNYSCSELFVFVTAFVMGCLYSLQLYVRDCLCVITLGGSCSVCYYFCSELFEFVIILSGNQ